MFLETVRSEYECSGCDINDYGVEQTRRRTGLSSLRVGFNMRPEWVLLRIGGAIG